MCDMEYLGMGCVPNSTGTGSGLCATCGRVEIVNPSSLMSRRCWGVGAREQAGGFLYQHLSLPPTICCFSVYSFWGNGGGILE